MKRNIFYILFSFVFLICLLMLSTSAQEKKPTVREYEKPGYAQDLLGDYVYDPERGEHSDNEKFNSIMAEINKYPTIETEIMPNGTYMEKKENKFFVYYDRDPNLPNAKVVCLAYEVPDDTPLDADID